MAWSDAETARIENIEEFLNEIATQVRRLASKQQIRQTALLNERQVQDLTDRITALEGQVETLISRFNLGR